VRVGARRDQIDVRLLLEDSVVRDSLAREDGQGGRAISVRGGADLTLRRVLVERARSAGVSVQDPGSSLVAEDLIVCDVDVHEVNGTAGLGLAVGDYATAIVHRSVFMRNRDIGVLVGFHAGAQLRDLVIVDTRERPTGEGGQGLQVSFVADVDLERAVLRGNRETAFGLYGAGTTALVRDLTIHDTRSRQRDGTLGSGITVSGANLDLTRASVTESKHVGIWVGREATASVAQLRLDDTAPQACAATTCPEATYGIGFGAYHGAQLNVSDFDLSGAALCGFHLALDGTIDAAEGVVHQSTIGACIQNSEFDVRRMSRTVRYLDNERNMDAIELPIPEYALPSELPR
jgi:hypothetical protein